MLYLTEKTNILIAAKPVDFRNQIDGLVALCKNQLHQNPISGQWFIFVNRSKTMIRILCYEHNGYWVATKRLSKGRYRWPNMTSSLNAAQASELSFLLKNVLESKRISG